ncbi:MAG: lipase family protein [Selenomonadaceae bacterium]|nr:lipase family protein [Selenomonadaceae bacterium]
MLKKFFWLTVICLTVLMPRPTFAQLRAEDLQLTCAMASMAAYSSETSDMIRNELADRGWSLERIEAYSSKADAKALLLRRDTVEGRLNILSICGTEDQKDAEIDLRVKLVPFDIEGGSVHQGFNDYAEVLLSSDRLSAIIDEIAASGETLYLTGHSLGGAAAIIAAARLTERGLGDRISVMTFGAPAAGDRFFADHFNGRFKFDRITVSGDPIKKSLRALGYAHFGDEIKLVPAKSVSKFRHKMAVYLDCALRNYYDVTNVDGEFGSSSTIYALPLRLVDNSFARADVKYVTAIVRDVLSSKGAGVVFDPAPSMSIDYKEYKEGLGEIDGEYFARARAAGCDRVLMQTIEVRRVRESRAELEQVTVERIVCNLDGFPLSMQTSSVSTKELTVLEAVMFAQLQASL